MSFPGDRRTYVLLILLTAGLALAACTSGVAVQPAAEPAAQPEQTLAAVGRPTATPVIVEEFSLDQQVFISTGCSVCHGENAEGSRIAPALSGHSAMQVKRQARAPVGLMPPFPPDKLTDENLEAIVRYITGLEGGHAHQMAGGSGGELVMHHWMALFSLEDEQATESLHHIGHILELVEGAHLAAMRETEALVKAGDFHGAGHIVEGMLSGLDVSTLDESKMHLTLALSALRIEEPDDALHQLDHYFEVAEVDADGEAEAVQALIETGDLGAAESALEHFIGGEADEHGADEAGHDADEAGHDDGEMGHDEAGMDEAGQ